MPIIEPLTIGIALAMTATIIFVGWLIYRLANKGEDALRLRWPPKPPPPISGTCHVCGKWCDDGVMDEIARGQLFCAACNKKVWPGK